MHSFGIGQADVSTSLSGIPQLWRCFVIVHRERFQSSFRAVSFYIGKNGFESKDASTIIVNKTPLAFSSTFKLPVVK